MKKNLLMLAVLMFSPALMAADAVVGPVLLNSVGVVNLDSDGHKAGNIEIEIRNGIANLNGVNCNKSYVTTGKNGGAYNELISVLLTAHTAQRPLLLKITDNPLHTAYPGRCSIVWASMR